MTRSEDASALPRVFFSHSLYKGERYTAEAYKYTYLYRRPLMAYRQKNQKRHYQQYCYSSLSASLRRMEEGIRLAALSETRESRFTKTQKIERIAEVGMENRRHALVNLVVWRASGISSFPLPASPKTTRIGSTAESRVHVQLFQIRPRYKYTRKIQADATPSVLLVYGTRSGEKTKRRVAGELQKFPRRRRDVCVEMPRRRLTNPAGLFVAAGIEGAPLELLCAGRGEGGIPGKEAPGTVVESLEGSEGDGG